MEHKIIVAGIGPGAPEYMLPAARAAVEKAAVIAGGKRALETYAPPGAQTKAITGDIAATLAFIEAQLETKDVTVLVSGDPGYYSLLAALRRRFGARRLTVIPGVSSMQLAFARLALPWQEAKLLSFHGRVPDKEELAYRSGALLGMLTDTIHTSSRIAAVLLAAGWPPESQTHVCARLSYENETICALSLAEAAAAEGTAHCIMIVSDEADDAG